MKTRLFPSVAAAWLLALVVPATVHAAIQASYYVAPTGSGSDSNNGTSPSTPFATLTKARDVVRTVNSSMTGDIMIYLLPGDHLVTTAIALSDADSGTNGHHVVWAAYGDKGSARIIGGTKVTSWSLDGAGVYVASVPAGTRRLEAIYEGGVRGRLGRQPNLAGSAQAYYTVESKDSTYPKKKFKYKAADTIPSIATITDTQVLVWPGDHDWSPEIHDVAAIDRTNRWITFTNNIQLAYLGGLDAGSRYYIQGARELVNEAGEFYHDRTNGLLYYYPRNGIGTQEIIVPSVTDIFHAEPLTGTQDLTGSWQLENDTSDSSSSSNDGAAINAPGYVTSQTGLGDAISLDGSTQYVTVPDSSSLEFGAPANPFAITAWIKAAASSGILPIVCKARPDPGTQNMDYKFWLNASGKLEFQRWNTANSNNKTVTAASAAALDDGTWHHVAFVNESATSHKLYIDGSLVQTDSTTWSYSCTNDQDVELGRYKDNHNGNTYYFAGALDDVRIYQTALAAADITTIYQMQPPSTGLLQNITFLNLKFAGTNFDYGDAAGKTQGALYFRKASHILILNNEFTNIGGNAVKIVGPGSDITVTGNHINDVGYAGIFADGVTASEFSNNRIHNTGQFAGDSGSNIRLDNVGTSSVLHNTLSTSSRHGVRLKGTTFTTVAYNEVRDSNNDSQDTGAIYWGYSDDNTIDHNRAHDSGRIGQQHGFYIEDGSDRTVVTNNIVYGISSTNPSFDTSTINVKGVGNRVENNIFDFSAGDAGMTTFEILANAPANSEKLNHNIFYSQGGSTTFYNFKSYAANRLAQSDNNIFYKTAAGSNIMKGIPGDDTLSNWKTIISGKYDGSSVTTNPGFVDATNHNYNFSAGAPSGFNAIDASRIGLRPEFIYPGTTGQWTFSGNADDLTLNGNDGSASGASYVADHYGDASSALSLNGASNYVNVPDDASLDFGHPANPFTIVAWVKTTGATTGGIVAKARDTNSVNMDYRLQLLATGVIQFSRFNQAAGTTDTFATTATVNNNAWHHVAFVNEGAASHKLYIDGVLAATSATTWTNDNTNAEPVRIGRDRNGSTSDSYFNGSIDDVAILRAALSADDIKDLNHLPHP